MKSILDPSFCCTNGLETDMRKTFAKFRRELDREAQERSTAGVDVISNVLPLRPREAGSQEPRVRTEHPTAADGTFNGSTCDKLKEVRWTRSTLLAK